MREDTEQDRTEWRISPARGILFCLAGIAINLAASGLMDLLHIPLYMDVVGTMLAAALGGYLPGVIVGLATNLLHELWADNSMYYGVLNVLIAICTTWFAERGYLKKKAWIPVLILVLTLIGGGHGAVMTWLLFGYADGRVPAAMVEQLGEWLGTGSPAAQIIADVMVDVLDKILSTLLVVGILWMIPERVKQRLYFRGWQQAPLSDEIRAEVERAGSRGVSLRIKILLLLVTATVAIAAIGMGIAVMLFQDYTQSDHIKQGKGIAKLIADTIDAEQVNDYIEQGEAAEGYLETEQRLYDIMHSLPDIQYLYIYQIREDGCHVVFDLDTEDLKADDPGAVVDFDESFLPCLDDLLAGKEIEPIVSNDKYGWLLTVYQPVYDGEGQCVCYAAVDVAMNVLQDYRENFLMRLIALFLGFFILIFVVGLWFAEYNIVLPVNTMAICASAFAYNSEEARESSEERIRGLQICTGDELENLYQAFLKTTQDSMQYVEDIQHKTEQISEMQNGLILVLADIVESRDKCTGDHVRKTAAYTDIIMRKMKEKGYYADQLTDEFVSNVIQSAPLHDIGKIQVKDAILNKPGKLTDEEFEEMKQHTVAGSEIISRAIESVPDSAGYLQEAKNLAEFHHEKWNGKGYPTGLAGEEIPLSARIMAVADVFDALISKRSYKKPFTFEKAIDIIREGVGTHFDPYVAEAFLEAEQEVRSVAKAFGEL